MASCLLHSKIKSNISNYRPSHHKVRCRIMLKMQTAYGPFYINYSYVWLLFECIFWVLSLETCSTECRSCVIMVCLWGVTKCIFVRLLGLMPRKESRLFLRDFDLFLRQGSYKIGIGPFSVLWLLISPCDLPLSQWCHSPWSEVAGDTAPGARSMTIANDELNKFHFCIKWPASGILLFQWTAD